MRRLQKTIEEIGWTKSVPKFAKGDMVGRAFDAMSREAHDCVLIVDGEEHDHYRSRKEQPNDRGSPVSDCGFAFCH